MRIVALVPFAAIAMGCGRAERADPPLTLESLAVGWSGGRTDPTCQSRGPRGEHLGVVPGAQYCQWPTVARGPERGTVGAHRDSVIGYSLLAWERVFGSEASLAQLADSLSEAFRARGMRERPCVLGGRRWESETLGVELMRSRSHPGVVAMIVATTLPKAMSQLTCPATPPPGVA